METHDPNRRAVARGLLLVAAFLLLGAAALLWSWNTLGHGLFGGPKAQYVHALALLAGFAVLALPFRARRR